MLQATGDDGGDDGGGGQVVKGLLRRIVAVLRQAGAWLAALLLLAWRTTCRYEVIDDPRPTLRAAGEGYVYALLHAHQLAAVFVNDEEKLAAMVSRSGDGALLVPSLRLRRVHAVRGSSRKGEKDKGGREALAELHELVREGVPVLLAVDGPRGPRNRVKGGVARLAAETRLAVLPTLVLPDRRWFLAKTWDRFQIPKPFSKVRLIFAAPIRVAQGEPPADLRTRISSALDELERRWDPAEAPPQP